MGESFPPDISSRGGSLSIPFLRIPQRDLEFRAALTCILRQRQCAVRRRVQWLRRHYLPLYA